MPVLNVIAHAWTTPKLPLVPLAVLGIGLLVFVAITYDTYRRHWG